MEQEEVLKFYVLCNRLKNTVRTGWKTWHVDRERVESIAEHIYSTQMLALAMYSQFHYDIDIYKVVMMMAIHEMEETIIGDYTPYQIDEETKLKIGHEAVLKALEPLNIKEQLSNLIFEFDARETNEARFAYYCDKLECDLQCKMYDEEGCVDLENQADNHITENPMIKELIAQGNSWSGLWLKNDLKKIGYDENFASVSEYALSHNIHDLYKDEDK